jgi:hypothetical protein
MEENNMHVASLENCKALYEVSGWKTEDFEWYHHNTTDTPDLTYVPGGSDLYGEPVWPAYDLGYLLRQLAVYWDTSIRSEVTQWCAETRTDRYNRFERARADTPEDAACKLAIELFKQGVLTKEPGLEVADSDE